MYDHQYLDKRDPTGQLLKFRAYEHAQEITEKFAHIISDSKIIETLCNNFPKKYIKAYFNKIIFYEILPISHQIIICESEKKDKNESKINTRSFSMPKELIKILPNAHNLILEHKLDFSVFKEKAISFLKPFYYNSLKFKKKNIQKKINLNEKNFVAVCYAEGISENKRSDLFWLHNGNTSIKNIILYIDHPYQLRRTREKKLLNKLEQEGKINVIKIWEIESFEGDIFYKKIKEELYKVSKNDYLDKILLKKSLELLNKIEFWHNFFKNYKVKVHMDPHEMGNDNLVKQIAISLVDGCSLGINRSYINAKKGMHYEYYPNDVFFCWGKKAMQNIQEKVKKKTLSKINNLLINGNPFNYIANKSEVEIQSIKKKLQKNGVDSVILLLDTSADDRNNNHYFDQLFPYKELESFYTLFFKWVLQNKKIGLIIKPKKDIFKYFKRSNSNKNLLNKVINSNRCHFVEDPFQKIPSHYTKISDFVVSLSADSLPSALLDCITNGKNIRAVFFDHTGLETQEPDLFPWGLNNVVFKELNSMMTSLENFIHKPEKNNKFGIWPEKYISELDPFRDGNSGNRLAKYIECLLKGFDNGLNKKKAISFANENFSQKWGSNNLVLENE